MQGTGGISCAYLRAQVHLFGRMSMRDPMCIRVHVPSFGWPVWRNVVSSSHLCDTVSDFACVCPFTCNMEECGYTHVTGRKGRDPRK